MKLVIRLSYYFAFLVVTGLSVGCNRQSSSLTDAALATVASVVEERPDSALEVIDRLDRLISVGEAQLRNGEQKARYALLKSQTLDKNWIDVTNDSLIRIAVQYYDRYGSDRDRMKAWFYLAAVQRNNMDYNAAFKSYGRAEDLALQAHDTAMLVIIYGNMSYICHYSYSRDDLHYGQLSYQLAKESGNEKGRLWGMAYMAHAYSFGGQDAKADSLFRILLKEGAREESVIQYLLPIYIRQSLRNENYALADSLCQMQKPPFYADDYVNRACIFEQKGMRDSVECYLDSAETAVTIPSEVAYIYEGKRNILEHRKDYQGALQYLKMRVEKQDSVILSVFGQSVSAAQHDLLLQQKELIEQKAVQQRFLAITGISALTLVLCAVCLLFYNRYQRNRRMMDKYLESARELTRTLQQKDADLHAQHSEMQAKILKLFSNRFSLIDSICAEMQENTYNQKKVIFEKLQKEIQQLASDEQKQSALETIIDDYFNGIMRRLRASDLDLKDNNMQLLSYMIARFSNKSTMLLMSIDDYEVLKKRKTRLKEKLRKSDLDVAEEVLSYLPGKEI